MVITGIIKAYNGKEATLTNKMEADWMLDH